MEVRCQDSRFMICLLARFMIALLRKQREKGAPKMKGKLLKEPDNEYDKEAIKVEMPGIGQMGYVANSPYTVVGESYSAGRLYDKIGDTAKSE